MKKTRLLACLLSTILSFGLLCSCEGKTGPQGAQGPQGPAGKDGSSFLTGKGVPENDLGKRGDSYLDIEGEEWGLYIKGKNGWELLGFIEAEPAPAIRDLSEFNGTYELSHVIQNGVRYDIGDTFYIWSLSRDMIQVELNNGVGNLTVNFSEYIHTNITCAVDENNLIMTCEDYIDLGNGPHKDFYLSIIEDGDMYIELEVSGGYYYVKKVN